MQPILLFVQVSSAIRRRPLASAGFGQSLYSSCGLLSSPLLFSADSLAWTTVANTPTFVDLETTTFECVSFIDLFGGIIRKAFVSTNPRLALPILESREYRAKNLRGRRTRYFVKKKILDSIVGTGWLSEEEATDNPAALLTKQLFVDHQAIHDLCQDLNPTKQFRKKNQWCSDDVIDNPSTLMAQQLFVDHEGIQALCEQINPLKQFEMLRETTQPGPTTPY
jgi:hypothetical protein